MNYYSRLQQAVDFIEANLDQAFTLTDVSNAAFSSLSYLHRVFYSMTGYTVKEYIRKRRLSLAASRLRTSNESVTDIAMMAGYDAVESFSRAFKTNIGIGPRAFRHAKEEFLLFNKLNILDDFSQQTNQVLDFEIIREFVLYQETWVNGLKIRTTIEGGQEAVDICKFAGHIFSTKRLNDYFNMNNPTCFGVYTNMTDQNEFDYTIACPKLNLIKTVPELVEHVIPHAQYARFTFNARDRIKEAWQYIYGQWFPKQKRIRGVGLDFEIYHPEKTAIYIPID